MSHTNKRKARATRTDSPDGGHPLAFFATARNPTVRLSGCRGDDAENEACDGMGHTCPHAAHKDVRHNVALHPVVPACHRRVCVARAHEHFAGGLLSRAPCACYTVWKQGGRERKKHITKCSTESVNFLHHEFSDVEWSGSCSRCILWRVLP